MKLSSSNFFLLILSTLTLGSCSTGNPCERLALETIFAGTEDACYEQSNECCSCLCWSDNFREVDKYDVATRSCLCGDIVHPGDDSDGCPAAAADTAEACLRNPDCIESAKQVAKAAAWQACAETPL